MPACGETAVARTDNRAVELVRTHRKAAVLLCALVTALGGLVIVLVLGQGSASWTGVEVTVPSCPASAQGCRLFVTHPDGTAVVHADWSGAGATIDVQLPPGSYLVSAEGCAGDQIGNVVSSVRAGMGTTINLGSAWQPVGFVDRTCPGFATKTSG
jgi:hypothetical protein